MSCLLLNLGAPNSCAVSLASSFVIRLSMKWRCRFRLWRVHVIRNHERNSNEYECRFVPWRRKSTLTESGSRCFDIMQLLLRGITLVGEASILRGHCLGSSIWIFFFYYLNVLLLEILWHGFLLADLAERSLRHAGLQLSRKEWNLKIVTCIDEGRSVIVSANEAGTREWNDVQEGQVGLSR